jgi:hypothetical protein
MNPSFQYSRQDEAAQSDFLRDLKIPSIVPAFSRWMPPLTEIPPFSGWLQVKFIIIHLGFLK